MVLSIVYPAGHSSTDWGFIISNGVSGGAPDENAIYMFANKITENDQSLDVTTYKSNGKSRRSARGKRKIVIRGQNVWIPTSSMTEINTIKAQVNTWKTKAHAPIYLWIRSKVSGSWVYADFPNEAGSMVDYLMGYIEVNQFTYDAKEGFFLNITFSSAYQGA